MRIGIVSETFPPEINGVALTVQRFVDGLRQRGHQVDVVRPRQASDRATPSDTLLVRGAGIPNYPGLRFGLPCARTLRRHWCKQRPDVIYVATEGPLGGSALRAAHAEGIPAASGFHTRFDHYARHYGLSLITPLVRQHLRRFHRRAAATLVPTHGLASELATLGIDNACVLHRAVDPHRFHPRFRDPGLRARWGASDDTPVALYVGRIAPEKNLQLAVRGFRALQARAPRARFVWVGDGPARAELQAAHPDFVFAGVQRGEALARHYASSDLFIFPSLSETFGNVVLEALASGVPAVAFDEGAARQHVQDGINGRTVPADSGAAFVRACVSLADTDERRPMQQAARQSVASLTPDSMVDAFENLLKGIRDAALAPASSSSSSLPPGATP